jgi:hypothetical protein
MEKEYKMFAMTAIHGNQAADRLKLISMTTPCYLLYIANNNSTFESPETFDRQA